MANTSIEQNGKRPPIHEMGAILMAAAMAILAGLSIGRGVPMPPVVEVGLTGAIGYFFGAAVWRQSHD